MRLFTLEELRQDRDNLKKELANLKAYFEDKDLSYSEGYRAGSEDGEEVSKDQLERLAAAEKVCMSCIDGPLERDFDLDALAAWQRLVGIK